MDAKIPVLQLELKAMGEHIRYAMMSRSNEISSMVNAALAEVCTPEYVEALIRSQADSLIKQLIGQEVHNYFLFGKGNNVVRSAVNAFFDEPVVAEVGVE